MPTNYEPINDYSDELGTTLGLHLDQDFASVASSINTVTDSLALVQRGDGRLGDVTVEIHTLSQEVFDLIGGFTLRDLWVTGTAYAVNDLVIYDVYFYVCTTAHTAGVSFTAAYWKKTGFANGTDAAAQAAIATAQAGIATTQAGTATTQAGISTAQAVIATTQAGIATAQAVIATTQAGNALTSATNSANSAAASSASAGTAAGHSGSAASSAAAAADSALLATAAAGIQLIPIAATVAANALTIDAGSLVLDFRSATLGDGTITRVTGTPASIVVPSGATLGITNGHTAYLVVLALNNAGTIEVAVCNATDGINLNESELISTTILNTSSDSWNVAYSTTARTNVAFRIIGLVQITCAAAGTWASAPIMISGAGGDDALLHKILSVHNRRGITLSGTSVDITAIPEWVTEITLMINGMSTNGTSIPIVQVGDETLGIYSGSYACVGENIPSGSVVTTSFSAGFGLAGAWTAASAMNMVVTLTKVSNYAGGANDMWFFTASGARTDVAYGARSNGVVIMENALSQLRLTTVGGANTFDNGVCAIRCR
jgi:hypothetical protein